MYEVWIDNGFHGMHGMKLFRIQKKGSPAPDGPDWSLLGDWDQISPEYAKEVQTSGFSTCCTSESYDPGTIFGPDGTEKRR